MLRNRRFITKPVLTYWMNQLISQPAGEQSSGMPVGSHAALSALNRSFILKSCLWYHLILLSKMESLLNHTITSCRLSYIRRRPGSELQNHAPSRRPLTLGERAYSSSCQIPSLSLRDEVIIIMIYLLHPRDRTDGLVFLQSCCNLPLSVRKFRRIPYPTGPAT